MTDFYDIPTPTDTELRHIQHQEAQLARKELEQYPSMGMEQNPPQAYTSRSSGIGENLDFAGEGYTDTIWDM
jgi:hypothetical protein